VRQNPDDDLEQHEGDDQDERDRQVPAIGIRSDAVRMPRTAVIVVAMIMLMSGAAPIIVRLAHITPLSSIFPMISRANADARATVVYVMLGVEPVQPFADVVKDRFSNQGHHNPTPR